MKAQSTEEVLELNTKAKRNLSLDDLKAWYTEDELKELIYKAYPDNSKPVLTDLLHEEHYNAMKIAGQASVPRKLLRWTPKEEEFLRASYKYISDRVIGLALNLPAHAVLSKRKSMKLSKDYNIALEVVVWCNREDFKADLEKQGLLKARPDILETLCSS